MHVIVLVVDDDGGFRRQLRRLLSGAAEVQVVEAAEGEEAVRLAAALQPEVVLMDIAMPRTDGLEATRRIKAARELTKVIVLTVHDEEAYRRAARQSGADDFVVKKRAGAQLIPAIQSLVPVFSTTMHTQQPPDSTSPGGTAPSAH
jgi:DNA-binding NarL/FixJ family response regulator